MQEVQTRLTKAGFDTGGTDGRVGNDTMKAVKDYQTKMGLLPADGYGGLKVLARLRQGLATTVIACDKREAFAQGSESTKQSIPPRKERWIASLRSQ